MLTAVVRRAGSFIFDAAQRKQGEGVGGLARDLAGRLLVRGGETWGRISAYGPSFSLGANRRVIDGLPGPLGGCSLCSSVVRFIQLDDEARRETNKQKKNEKKLLRL